MESDEPIMTDLIFSEAEVSCVLRSLDSSKATGPDGIPARLLKETADVITHSLCELFNRSVLTGTMAEEWKVANIVPCTRKGTKSVLRTIVLSPYCALHPKFWNAVS